MKIILTGTALSALALGLAACSKSSDTSNNLTSDAKQEKLKPDTTVRFKDVSAAVGLITENSWKYGGPAIVDLSHDGHYDLLLTNHDKTPIQVFNATGDGRFTEQTDIYKRADLHGISAGDYDLDGDNDILISLGGGNGTKPQPQRLLRNNNGEFEDVTVEAGISEMGARGRTVRWIDLDADGDLDFMQINAEKMLEEDVPRNILFENTGDGKFTYRKSPAFENIDGERVLLTDVDNDNILDLLVFSSYEPSQLWRGLGDFKFENVTESVLPQRDDEYRFTIAAAHADIDNDGDLDLYLARGKLFYQIADNSISFDKQTGRLDLRDEGNESHDGMTLESLTPQGDLELSAFYHFPRAKRLDVMPIFLGAEKTRIEPPTDAVTVSAKDAKGFPNAVTESGWYLGHIEGSMWRMEWKLTGDLAWDIRGSIGGLSGYQTTWDSNAQELSDILLRNNDGVFEDVSHLLGEASHTNNWGVTPGDFNNDGYDDFFVHRFGELRKRSADLLLTNNQGQGFSATDALDATTEIGRESHGDMGTAFDYNLDGKIDLLNGDEDEGQWHMYENISDDIGNYVLVRVGYSGSAVDPYGARIWVDSKQFNQTKIVGSTSATHSQSLLNIAHFGLAEQTDIKSIKVRWRDGSEKIVPSPEANSVIQIGSFKSVN